MERRNGLLIGGLAVGAGLMYLLDPASGRRRRALLCDKMVHARKLSTDRVGSGARDVANRGRGLAARVRSTLRREPVDDRRVEERVRAKIGRVVANPGELEVHSSAGVVTLSGAVATEEADALLRSVQTVPGVRQVVDRLTPRLGPAHPPELRGAPA
jgi:osmotically-inducible protein OsmY